MDPSHAKRYDQVEIEQIAVDVLNQGYPDGVQIPVDIDLLAEQQPSIGDIITAKLE